MDNSKSTDKKQPLKTWGEPTLVIIDTKLTAGGGSGLAEGTNSKPAS